VSFDIYLQDFSDEPEDRSHVVGALLSPLLDDLGQRVRTVDGSASVYGASDSPLHGLMFNHVEGESAWDLIYDVAVASHWAIMPVGCPICLVDDGLIGLLPSDLLEDGYVVVHDGADILSAIKAA
jgi:hypothetical protein